MRGRTTRALAAVSLVPFAALASGCAENPSVEDPSEVELAPGTDDFEHRYDPPYDSSVSQLQNLAGRDMGCPAAETTEVVNEDTDPPTATISGCGSTRQYRQKCHSPRPTDMRSASNVSPGAWLPEDCVWEPAD
jgi:hypothetical protein